MKSSQLEGAQKLVATRDLYERMQRKLREYPGYDANLVIDGDWLNISRTQASVILDDYIEATEKALAELGVEYGD